MTTRPKAFLSNGQVDLLAGSFRALGRGELGTSIGLGGSVEEIVVSSGGEMARSSGANGAESSG